MVSRNDEVKRIWKLRRMKGRKGLMKGSLKLRTKYLLGYQMMGRAWYAFIIYSIVLCASAICIVSMNVMANVRWARELV